MHVNYLMSMSFGGKLDSFAFSFLRERKNDLLVSHSCASAPIFFEFQPVSNGGSNSVCPALYQVLCQVENPSKPISGKSPPSPPHSLFREEVSMSLMTMAAYGCHVVVVVVVVGQCEMVYKGSILC